MNLEKKISKEKAKIHKHYQYKVVQTKDDGYEFRVMLWAVFILSMIVIVAEMLGY